MRSSKNQRALALGGMLACSVLAAVDWAIGGDVVLVALLYIVPLAVATRAGQGYTTAVAVYATALAIALGVPEDIFGETEHLIRILVVGAGGALAIWISGLRERTVKAEQRSRFTAEAGTRLDMSLDFDTVVRTLAEIPVPTLADWAAVYVLEDDGAIRQVAEAHTGQAERGPAWSGDRSQSEPAPTIGISKAIRDGEPQLVAERPDSGQDAGPYRGLMRSRGLRTAIFVPLLARGESLGALALASAESGRTFGEEELRVAQDLADRAALAVLNARLYTQISEAQTEVSRAAAEVQAILQGVASGITVQDRSGRLVYANETAAEMLRMSSVQSLLQTPPERIMDKFEICNEELEPIAVTDLPGRVALAGGDPPDQVVFFKERATGDERWSLVKATPIRDGEGIPVMVVNIFDDITDQKRRELAQRFLSEGSSVLAASLDYETTLDNVAHLAVPQFADWCGVDLVDERGAITHVALAHVDPSKIELAEAVRHRYPEDPDAEGGAAEVIRTGEAQLYPDIPDEMLVHGARDEQHLAMLRALGLRSAIVAPLVVGGRAIGALSFITSESGRRFDEQDLEIARELARRAAHAVENARLYAERSHIAQTLQRSLLPPVLPAIPGVELAARFRPAGEGYDVGGDFYDVFNTGGADWGIVIGDVCGKGPEAAALTGLARHTLRAAAMQEHEPSRILTMLSEAIARERSDSQFCTAAYGRLEPDEGGARLTVASGGHPLPLLLGADGGVEEVGETGSLLGLFADTGLVDVPLELLPGAALVFYTDGVIEAGQPRGSFGVAGLGALLSTCAGLSATEIAERVDRAVVGLEPEPSDDIAVLVLRVRE